MTTRIVFNGQEYASPDAMPPEVRRAYDELVKQLGDADQDGIPDVLQQGALSKMIGLNNVRTSITINSQTYESPDQMPASVRQLYDEAMARVGKEQGTVPLVARTELIAKAGKRSWTFKVTAGQLLTLALLFLVGFALVLLFETGRHR